MLSLVSASFAFNAAPAVVPATRAGVVSMAISNPSNAVPFLTAPPSQSSGLPGAETGFDPLYLSEYIDVKWAREAELKHGRICMLACLGIFVQEFISLPGYPGYDANPVAAFSSVDPQALAQIFVGMSIVELVSNKGKYSSMDMFEDGTKTPGDFGFDPLNYGKDPSKRAELEMKELKNGRLAMLGFSGAS
mmetsp:Transcript_15724/g.33613  ORF Transcript_15724/g.33613 Transcript_15724/m.33613 type:complete len:191 (+) Transcript_15724:96-668(+)